VGENNAVLLKELKRLKKVTGRDVYSGFCRRSQFCVRHFESLHLSNEVDPRNK